MVPRQNTKSSAEDPTLKIFLDVVLLSIHLLINLMSKNFTEFILSHCDFEIEQLLSNYLHEIDSMPNSALQGFYTYLMTHHL